MRKGKERRERSETLSLNSKEEEIASQEEEEVGEEANGGFFACYLLCSLCPRYKGQTYIGFTVNPRRRIRQHNGELRSGAWRTKSKRPWEMILCIYGFPTNVTALQFEWAWQHPTESLAVRKAAVNMKSLSGIVGKIKLAYTMLTLPPWQRLNLTVNFFSTKYMKDAAGCKSLPKQMKVQYCPMDELPCYTGGEQIFDEMEDQDEDAENGTHVEGPTDTSVNDILKLNENDGVTRQPRKVFTERVEEKPLSLIEEDKPEEALSLRGEDDRLACHLVDSPLVTSSRSANLVNSVQNGEDEDLLWSEMSSREFGKETKQQSASPVAAKEAQVSPELGRKPFDSSPRGCRRQFSLVDTPMKTPFADMVNDKEASGWSPGNNSSDLEKHCSENPSFAQPPTTKCRFSSTKVEVIDISTPSANRITQSFRSKKRRNNWMSQEVIDLTKSPN